jgi:tetratricopeptide (TPR) repeat protein
LDWLAYIQDKAYRCAADIGNPEPLEQDGDGPPGFREFEHTFIDQSTALRKALATADYGEALRLLKEHIEDLRIRISRNPESAEYHYSLGAMLGLIGCKFNMGALADEGVLECRIASQLDPTWDIPLLEIGIIRMRQGDFDGARLELEAAIHGFGKATPGLAFNLAEARMFCGDFMGAIALFELVTREVPNFAEAIDRLAFCCVRSGNTIRGKQLAREARHLGGSWTYDNLENGRLE